MQKKIFHRFARLVGTSLFVVSLTASPQVLAQSASTGGAGAQTAADAAATLVAQIKQDSALFLASYPQGGLALSLALQSVIQSDPTLVDTIVAMSVNANAVQIRAIARVLATAAKVYLTSNPLAAQNIQLAVANSGNQPLIDAFNAAINETQTAALPGGPANGGGGTPIGDAGGPPPGDPTGNGSGSGGTGGSFGGAGFTATFGVADVSGTQ